MSTRGKGKFEVGGAVSLLRISKPRRSRSIDMPEHLPRIVDLRARHGVDSQHCDVRCRRLQIKAITDALPERIKVRHRPLPQRVIAVKRQAAIGLQPLLGQADLGTAEAVIG
jgi:hypothetical protein